MMIEIVPEGEPVAYMSGVKLRTLRDKREQADTYICEIDGDLARRLTKHSRGSLYLTRIPTDDAAPCVENPV